MSDVSKLIPGVMETLRDVWDDVVSPAFDNPASAVRWLTRKNSMFNNQKPLDMFNGNERQRASVIATLNRFDGLRVG